MLERKVTPSKQNPVEYVGKISPLPDTVSADIVCVTVP